MPVFLHRNKKLLLLKVQINLIKEYKFKSHYEMYEHKKPFCMLCFKHLIYKIPNSNNDQEFIITERFKVGNLLFCKNCIESYSEFIKSSFKETFKKIKYIMKLGIKSKKLRKINKFMVVKILNFFIPIEKMKSMIDIFI
jgi:hypothetical protein